MSVSKTHAVVGPDPDGVWVQDLRSTNGTAITTANGMRTAVPAGGRAVAGLGAVVHIGKVAFKVAEQ
jgi:pSer/pThr/pTyr-binding forkhead associated (FHA) protein